MFKAIAISSALVLPILAAAVAPAQADHVWRKRWVEPDFFSSSYEEDAYDRRYDGRFIDDEDENVIVVPRKKRLARDAYIDELYDFEDDVVVPRAKKVKPKVVAKPVVKPVVKVAAKPVVKTVAKPKLVQVVSVSKPAAKPVVKAPVVAAKPTPVATPKQARLVMPSVDRPSVVAPKTTRAVPSAPLSASTISCEKANEIVTGYGFTSVSPLICVGKTYRFKAVRDGKNFEINLSAASGELTEVKKL